MQNRHKIKIGISSCLLGEEVRFDGGHKRDRFITDRLSAFVKFVPTCPELAIGLGVPRQPIRLVAKNGIQRALGTKDDSLDVTDDLIEFAHTTSPKFNKISGYIFKSKSPSCGMARVKLYQSDGPMPNGDGIGLYARTIMKIMPNLPVEEEGRLNDPVLKENFIERIFVYQRWQEMIANRVNLSKLVDFHTRHKLTIMAHGQVGLRQLGRIVANNKKDLVQDLAEQYVSRLMSVLKQPATRNMHTNVLQHVQGYLKNKLDKSDKQELTQTIEQYRLGYLPLIVPITLLHHHFRRNPVPYISEQIYLSPHPPELMLRNSL
ncbi:YbgA family protein [Pseudomonadota bacterium]